ncbi:endonuclease NucS [[Eubacterium] cellulosolvens]
MTDALMIDNTKPRLSFSDVEEKIKGALRSRKTVVIIGNCMVEYSGRAQSTLEYGDRVILVKQDGALLIHRPNGYLPVNWQPSRCHFHIGYDPDHLDLKAVRVSPSEKVHIRFRQVYAFSALKLKDEAQFSLYASEMEMQQAIMVKPDLLEPGFKILGFEKKVEPGFIDIYGQDREGRRVVVEIKRNLAGKEAALQLGQYIRAIADDRPLRGIIAAPMLGKGCQRLLKSLNLEFRQIDPQECSEILLKMKKNPHDRSIYEYL